MQRTPTPDDVVRKISKDVSVELQSHVMDNFRAQAFYDQPWTPIRRKGTILVQTAKLRNSIRYIPQARGVTITSSKPYAQIHNEFQFQYGAIESMNTIVLLISLVMFQFQYGAIESASVSSTTSRTTTFQFQYGAIESQWR